MFSFHFRWGVFGRERHKWECFRLPLPGPGPQLICSRNYGQNTKNWWKFLHPQTPI